MSEEDRTAELITMAHVMVAGEVSKAADCTFQWPHGSEKPFGGIIMVFSGDWRQILTVVPHGSRTEIVERCLKSSYLWRNVKILHLTQKT